MEESGRGSNDEWFVANLQDLVEKYPNQWIGVVDGTVVSTSSSRRRAQKEARRLAGDREFSVYFVEPSMLQMGLKRTSPPANEGTQ